MHIYITFLWFEIQPRDDKHDTKNGEHYNRSVTKGKGKVIRHF